MATVPVQSAFAVGADDEGMDVVLDDRAYEAHRLHLRGCDWTQVAAQKGYVSGRVAAMAVNAWLQKIALERAPERRSEALQTEIDRLDAVQSAFWDLMLEGDVKAANVVLRAIAQRSKLLGLETVEDSLASKVHSIVIGGTTEEFVAGLKAVAGVAESSPAIELGV